MAEIQRRPTFRRTNDDPQPEVVPVEDHPVQNQVADDAKSPEFVKIVGDLVGLYMRGSVVSVAAFPYLQSLLDCGAVVYDYEATSESLTGNPEHLESIRGIGRSTIQAIPTAPWINSAPHELLGAFYTPLARQAPQPPISATQVMDIGPTVTLNR